MPLTQSVDKVDEKGREILEYGTEDFPVAFFDDDLTKVLVVPHWHEEFEFVIITEGKVHVRIAGQEMILAAGEGYFVNSQILHTEQLLSRSGHQHAMVFGPHMISMGEDLVWKSCITPILNNPSIPFIRLSSDILWQKEVLTMVEAAWQDGAYENADYPIQVRYLLSKAFSLLVKYGQTAEVETIYTDRFQRNELRIKKALLFIEQNYVSNITLKEIADSAAISTSSCLRLFNTILGTTPIRYLVDYRLQRACEELNNPKNQSIAEIAYVCGFTDASYFNRCFMKAYDMTPTEYMRSKMAEATS